MHDDTMLFEHATPWPRKGLKREKLGALQRGERLVSPYAWLRVKRRGGRKCRRGK